MSKPNLGPPLDELLIAAAERMQPQPQVGKSDFHSLPARPWIELAIAVLRLGAGGTRQPRDPQEGVVTEIDEAKRRRSDSAPPGSDPTLSNPVGSTVDDKGNGFSLSGHLQTLASGRLAGPSAGAAVQRRALLVTVKLSRAPDGLTVLGSMPSAAFVLVTAGFFR